MERQHIELLIKEDIASNFDSNFEKINPESNIMEEFDPDSLDIVQFLIILEDKFFIEFPEEIAELITTVGQIYDYVEKQVLKNKNVLTPAQVEIEIRKIIAKAVGIKIEKTMKEAEISRDLGIDSIKVVEITQKIERRFSIDLDDSFIKHQKIKDIIKEVKKILIP